MGQVVGLGLIMWLAVAAPAQDNIAVYDPLRDAAAALASALSGSAVGREAEVAAVDEQADPVEVYLAVEGTDGLVPGQVFELRARGEAIEVGGQVVGYKETTVGSAEVVRLQGDRLCVTKVLALRPGQKPAVGQVASLKTVPPRLAVLPFLRPDQAGMQLGTELADKLAIALTGSGKFQIVERERFQAVMGELGLGISDLYDPEKTTPLGKQLQAGGVVLGTVSLGDTAFGVTLRVVDIATGAQTASAQVPVLASEELRRKYAPVVRQVIDWPGNGPVTPDSAGQVKVLYIGTDKDFVHNEQLAEFIRQAGFQVDVKPAMPESASGYDVVVIESDAASQSGIGDVLYGLVGSGKGVVLTGPALFNVIQRGSSATTRWEGCSQAGGGDDMHRTDDVLIYAEDLSIQLAKTNPFNSLPGISVGTEVYSAKGRAQMAGTTARFLESSATVIAQLPGVITNDDGTAVVAYASIYGPRKGKVYFQALSYSPNHPKLHELFIGGIAWAAGLVGIDGTVPAGR